jgi:hypothetical protein
MSFVNAFNPTGPTVLVGTTSTQVTTKDNCYAVSYRIRNSANVDAYLSWAPALPLGQAVTVPAAQAPAPIAYNTIGISSGSTEVITLPPNAWFIANVAGGFEITPGEGV